MSYFIVPAVLYQTQQKLNKSKDAKKKKKSSSSSSSSSISSEKKHRHHRLHRAGSVGSGSSMPTTTSAPSPGTEAPTPAFLSHPKRTRSSDNYDGQSLHSVSQLTRIKELVDPSETHSLHTNNTSATDVETLHQDTESENYSVRYNSDLGSIFPVSKLDGHLKMIQPSYVSTVGIPVFNVITDLSVLNQEGYDPYFYAPAYQAIKYDLFLNIISDVRPSDPITFAGIRLQNLSNAIERYAISNLSGPEPDPFDTIINNDEDIANRFAEDQLSDDDDEEVPTAIRRSPESDFNQPMDNISLPETSISPIARVPTKSMGLGRTDPTAFLGRAKAQIQGTRLQTPSIDQRFHVEEKDIIKESEGIRQAIEVENPELRVELDKLSYRLLLVKQFVRTYICNLFGESTFPSEECLMANYINYIRYLLYLPVLEESQIKQLNEVERGHYANRHIFNTFVAKTKLRGKLISTNSVDDTADPHVDFTASSSNYDNILSTPENVQYLLHSVKRAVNEIVKLETYHVTLLTKFNNNSLVDLRVLTKMFDKFVRFKQLQQQTNKGTVHSVPSFLLGSSASMVSSSSITTLSSQVRVLHYNKMFSCQYGWYMALRMPFANIYEHNTNHQHQEKINGGYAAYNIEQEQTSKVSLQTLDQGSSLLQANFYKKLQEMTSPSFWLSYKMMTNEQLVQLDRDSQRHNSNQPSNFQYYCGTLAQLGSNSFDLIHSRDLQFQVTNTNIKTIIREFYRILKPEGVIECPVIQYCSKTDKLQFFGFWDYLGIDLDLSYNFIPNYVEVLTRELVEVFGAEYVKVGVSPLNTRNELNMYLLKHTALKAYETSGQLSDYCASERDFNDAKGSHVMIQIQATKKLC